MNCHNCGMPLPEAGTSPVVACEICHSFRSVDTPDDSADCIVPLDQSGGCHCPQCRRLMKQAAMDGLKVEYCGNCSGVLFDSDLFAMLVRNRRAEFRDAALQPVPLDDLEPTSTVRCPCCRRVMETHPRLGPNAIVIDSCIPCGLVWLDCRNVPTVDGVAALR